jgi:hypothetical protein
MINGGEVALEHGISDGTRAALAAMGHRMSDDDGAHGLTTGAGLSDPALSVETFPVEVRGDSVWVRVPPAARLVAPSLSAPCPAATPHCGPAL